MSIKYGFLADYFEGFGYKRLKPVEIDPEVSHEHEFNGINQFKKLFGLGKRYLPCRVTYLADDDDIAEDNVRLTWYDARHQHPTRSEYRLYYQDSDCFNKAAPEDLMIICKNRDDTVTMFIAKNGDTFENQLFWLFGIKSESVSTTGKTKIIGGNLELDYFSSIILEKIGISLEKPGDFLLDKILEKFPAAFPKTSEFSEFSRSFVKDVDPLDDIDLAITEWLDHEEYLFRVFEKYIVDKKLKVGFADVEDFISFSLSVQNRRKSRAGFALENHLIYALDTLKIKYSFNKVTENKAKPDFIFPGINEYHDKLFPINLLTMLGVKTSCKDRWRQVLAEANRISNKHLFTLEPGISSSQTNEMTHHKLQLIVPQKIFPTYTEDQRKRLMNLNEFIEHVKTLQSLL
jgi:hypothetical protein